MANRAVAQTLYRSLLRTARALDRIPAGRALVSLSTRPGSYYDRLKGEVVEAPQPAGVAGVLGTVLRNYLGGGEFYRPGQTLVEAVRAAREQSSSDQQLDVGIAALRVLGEATERAELVAPHLVDAERCGEVVRPLIRLTLGSSVRPGSLLVTHPLACVLQPSLHRAVILITSVGEQIVAGVVINKPQDTKVGAVVADEARKMLGPHLSGAMLHMGGDVARDALAALHDVEGVAGALPVGPGLWVSNDLSEGELRHALARRAAACEKESGLAAPRLKLVHGCAGWAPAQLKSELDRNVHI